LTEKIEVWTALVPHKAGDRRIFSSLRLRRLSEQDAVYPSLNYGEHAMKSCNCLPVTAILAFASGSPALYPGDCIQMPGGPVPTVRVVQQIGYDPPQFEVEFATCEPTARVAPDSDAETVRLDAADTSSRR
jgi:hypothetical protein